MVDVVAVVVVDGVDGVVDVSRRRRRSGADVLKRKASSA